MQSTPEHYSLYTPTGYIKSNRADCDLRDIKATWMDSLHLPAPPPWWHCTSADFKVRLCCPGHKSSIEHGEIDKLKKPFLNLHLVSNQQVLGISFSHSLSKWLDRTVTCTGGEIIVLGIRNDAGVTKKRTLYNFTCPPLRDIVGTLPSFPLYVLLPVST